MDTKHIKLFFKYSILFSYGGFVYMILELLFRHRTHYTMAFLGGLCFIFLDAINELISWSTPLILQGIIGGCLIVTPLEYLFGVYFNKDFSIWCYTNMPFNFQGQICLPFTILWCFVSIIGIVLADYLRYYIFNEEKPRYKIF